MEKTKQSGIKQVNLYNVDEYPQYFSKREIDGVKATICRQWAEKGNKPEVTEIYGNPEKGLYRVKVRFQKQNFIVWNFAKKVEE